MKSSCSNSIDSPTVHPGTRIGRWDELAGPVVVESPLRGEWIAVTSPGDRIPSHGVDMLGQRYAYDFIRTDRRRGLNVHPGPWRTNIVGGRTRDCYAWGQPVHMPFDGEVVAALDGYPERSWVLPIRELALGLKNALTFDPRRGLQPVVGNFVVAESEDGVRRLRAPDDGFGRRGNGTGGARRRHYRAGWSHRQLDRATPPLPADGWARPDHGERRAVRVPRARESSATAAGSWSSRSSRVASIGSGTRRRPDRWGSAPSCRAP